MSEITPLKIFEVGRNMVQEFFKGKGNVLLNNVRKLV
jgi:hypothetical protein